LFVAAYLAERWHTQLAIFTAPNPGIDLTTVQNYTRDYLELHEIQAEHIVMGGSLEALWRVVANRQIDVVLMGGYSTSPLGHVLFGSTVDSILRQAVCPLLICR
jgi:nucleotide-binding universal stress UspA family protein